jgi:cholesterol oxidase
VKELRPCGAGWQVVARDRSGILRADGHPPGPFDGDEVMLTARRVVLAAGTFGTTYLLLRLVRDRVLRIGDALGQCFSGNGDHISWISGSGVRLDGDRGPVVTSLFRSDTFTETADGRRVRRVRYVQDGGYPGLLGWLAETITPAAPARLARFAFRRWWAAFRRDPNRGLARDVSRLIGTSTSTTTLPLLGVGMDVADGLLRLHRRHEKRLDLAPPSGRSDAYYAAVSDTMTRIGAALQARRVIGSPWWGLRRGVTVHPLGGCPMGATDEDGVVNEWGEVFGYLDSLYVMDGSLMPGAIGPNPALTIAAVAHRASRHLLEQALARGAARPRTA